MSKVMRVTGWVALAGLIATTVGAANGQSTIDIEQQPIRYSQTEDDNPVSRLKQKLESGAIKLAYDRGQGYLPAVLKELDIPISSQVLVFSKTSLQVRYVSRRNPRAVYFNDDVYVAWIRGSSMMEVSTNDPKLGAAFYTFDMEPRELRIKQTLYDCLACHTTTMTRGVPGHTVRSVMPHHDGSINVQSQSFVTDHSSPMSERFGGWYVTGQHGEMSHMGNAYLRGDRLDTTDNGNRTNLVEEFDTQDYLSPLSDIVAQMVLHHQTQMHNVMTKSDFTVRKLLYDLDVAKANSADGPSKSSDEELSFLVGQAAGEVVEHLLFCNEAPLTSEVKGSEAFALQFTERGPRDEQGRSLRDFELTTRLFKYPCSYLVYSSAFDALQEPLRQAVLLQIESALDVTSTDPKFAHLDEDTRKAIHQILCETKPGYPAVSESGQE